MAEDYKGGYVKNTKVDRVEEAASEHAGPDGTGVARAQLDGRIAGPTREATPGGVIYTTNEGGVTTDASLKSRA